MKVKEKNNTPSKGINRVWKCFYLVCKRIFDIFISLIGLVFLVPIYIIIRIAYIISGDFNGILYTQDRIGIHGKKFKLYKYRSMIIDADNKLEELLNNNEDLRKEYKENKKLVNDPRVTKVGTFIRKYSIDELPQLLNVFIGNMSLIGNRPYLPREKKDMGKYFDGIVKTKPGLTGYWQINGRNDTSFNKRLQLEEYYSEHQCFKLDFKIFFKTFAVVLQGRGAK